jgi:hypothetical protein
VVTSGTSWQFFQMKGHNVIIDLEEYTLLPLERILGILKWMVTEDSS